MHLDLLSALPPFETEMGTELGVCISPDLD